MPTMEKLSTLKLPDNSEYYIQDDSAIASISRSGNTFTATKRDGSTFTFTQRDIVVSSSETNPNKFTISDNDGNTYDVDIIISDATQSEHGLMSASDKAKVDGIESGAEVNQFAFGKIRVTKGSSNTDIDADEKIDTFQIVEGQNVTLTPNSVGDKVEISAKDTTYTLTRDSVDHHKFYLTNNLDSTDVQEIIIQDDNTTYSISVDPLAGTLTLTPSVGDPMTVTIPFAGHASSADYADRAGADTDGDAIHTTYATDLEQDSSDGHVVYLKNKTGSTLSTFTIPDNNTTYTFSDGTNSFDVTSSDGSTQTVNVTPSIPDATQSAHGLMSASDKTKVDGIESGAEVNQNAFSNIVVGSTTISADNKTDTLTLVAGNNVTLSVDETTDVITLASSYVNTTYTISQDSTDPRILIFDGSDGSHTEITTAGKTYTLSVGTGDDANKIILTSSTGDVNKVTVPYASVANKVGADLVVQLNGGITEGTNKFTYNGSASKSMNITKASVGLGNVDNTADANKSVNHATTADSATTATNATNDADGDAIKSNYVHSIGISDHTITVKDKSGTSLGSVTVPDNDTKNTAGATDSSKKLFIIGAESQGANPQTYSQDTAYIGTDGLLYSGGQKVLTSFTETDPTVPSWAKASTKPSYTADEISGLGTAAKKNYTTSVVSGDSDLVTSGAVATAIANAIDNLPEPMVFKGTLGTNGTITELPASAKTNEGWTYKVITAGTYAGQASKVGDMFVSAKVGSTYQWVYVPSGDDVEDTWRNIKVNGTERLGTGISSGYVDYVGGTDIDATWTSSGNKIGFSHKTSGVTAGTYRSVTVNAQGHVTAGTNPTTLAGYGITDAKIANGVITLGSNTITPITDVSGKADKSETVSTVTWSNNKLTKTINGTTTDVVSAATILGNLTSSNVTTALGFTPATSGHTHDLSIASSTGTSAISLSANTKYVLTAGGKTFIFTTPVDTNTWRGIQNNLTSDSTTDSLSAAQGKELKTLVDGKASSTHTHTLSIASDSGTSALTLSANTKYKITAGGNSFIFTTPTDTNTWRPIGTGATDAAAGNHTHATSVATSTGTNQLTLGYGGKYSLTAGGTSFIFTMPASDNTDTKVTSVGNHYSPTADSSAQLSASASGGTAAWSIDVVQGVQLQRDAKGHVVGVTVTSGKIPGNPNTNYYHKTGSWNGLTYTAGKVGSPDDLAFTIPTGTSATTVAVGNHTHSTTIATSTGTNQLTLSHGGKYAITTGGTSFVFTMPTDTNTDTNVTQTATNTNANYEVLFSGTADNTTRTEGARKYSNLTFNPSTGTLTTTKVVSANATLGVADIDTANITEDNVGNLIVTGAARFLNTINGSISGNAATASDSAKLNGYASDTSATNNTIARRTANGYIFATYFNQSSGAETPTSSSYIIYANSDGYFRKSTVANMKTAMSLNNVENKSSATIRGELTSSNVTTALGYTPVNKAGDTITGRVAYNNVSMPLSAGKVTSLAAGTTEIFKDGIAISNPATSNDVGWMRVTGTGESDTVLEIATGDDGGGTTAETIVVRQYNTSNAVAHEAKLLDPSGNTGFPGNVTAPKFIGALQGNADTATSATSATKATQDGSGNVITSTYLKLSGGTMTGKIVSTYNQSTSWLYCGQNPDIHINNTGASGWIGGNTKTGRHVICTYANSDDLLYFNWYSNTTLAGTENKFDKSFTWNPATNVLSANISGNAATATKATQDESGNNIKASYAASFSISDHTITLKNKNGASLGTVTVPDNNTTYSAGTGLALSGTTFRTAVPRVAKDSHSLPGQNTCIVEEYTNGTNYNLPSNHYYHIYSSQGSDVNYGCQLALGMTTAGVYYREYNNKTWGSWRSLIDTDANTHRPIQMNGTEILGNNTTALNLKAGTNVSLSNSSGTVTITATDTTYSAGTGLTLSGTQFSVSAANASTIMNLLTTGSSAPTDNDYYIAQYAGGGTSTTTYHRRPHSALWSYIKGKADSTYLASTTKYAGSSSVGGAANSANQLNDNTSYINSGTAYVTHTDVSVAKTYLSRYNNMGINSSNSAGCFVLASNWSSTAYNCELSLGMGDSLGIYYRGKNNGTYTSWQAVGRFSATPTSGQVVITDGTTGGMKSSGYTIATSVPSGAKFTDTNYYHTTGSWSGLTYTATANGGAGALAFTIPTGTSATTVAVGNHTHGLLNNDFTVGLANTTEDSGWSMINSSYNGYLLKSIRFNSSSPAWGVGGYGSGICFGGGDTKGILSVAYGSPNIKIAGGNGTKPVWWLGLTGTSGTSYNLNDITNGNARDNTKLPLAGGTLTGNLTISHATSATMTADSTNPKITFAENGSQPVHLIYTDYDNYRSPAGLKVIGGASATPAWFEVEGHIYNGGSIYTSVTVCANTANSSTAGGLSLYGTDPTAYGVIFRGTGNQGKHGYVTSDWATYFTMSNTNNRGWVFRRQSSGNVASIDTSGQMVLNGSLTLGGNEANTSGCRLVYNPIGSLDFVFV